MYEIKLLSASFSCLLWAEYCFFVGKYQALFVFISLVN
ncbi:hypothetical protein GPLA_2127 [Paraglaciecola polaris LMG 21857]|uniref:Uncharacterized protein n=1 Tax=Paraglaciecola polaris LMG 21857 TaxID=1129793 RepID=K6ZRV0_9ALTE|nr:hypothetical protein GPLA_2127 [Paraglaciecola polaris LMG 21857]